MSQIFPEFRTARCTRYRFRYSACSRCLDACPHAAIALSDSGAQLDSARCQNCALCVAACHTGAWAGENYKPIDLLRQAIKQPAFGIACAPSGMTADAIVPCLGAVAPGMIAYLGKRHIPLALLGAGHCSVCAHGAKGAAQLARNLEAVALLRAADADAGAAWVAAEVPDTAPASPPGTNPKTTGADPASRRQLLRRLVGRGVDALVEPRAAVAPAPIPEKAIRPGAYASTEQRELLQIVCDRKDGVAYALGWHEALPLMQITLQQGCTACEACFRACPTGALQIVENPHDWALAFQIDRCVACAVCLEVCQPRVLDAAADFDARPEQAARVLHSLLKQRCKRCDRFFVSPTPAETCTVCRDDEDAFASIYG